MPRAKGSPHKVELAGQRFGKWVVLHRIKGALWRCKCDCGTEGSIQTGTLRLGKSKSCGCAGKDWCRTHGREGTSTYNIWAGLIQRCTNPHNREYPRYGGRGIAVCERWLKSFSDFLSDMGEKPAGKSIDRIDNDGNYEPGNCRWATRKEQQRNRSTTAMLTYRGKTLPMAAWAEKLGIKRKILERRIRDGWPLEKAFSKHRYGRWGPID